MLTSRQGPHLHGDGKCGPAVSLYEDVAEVMASNPHLKPVLVNQTTLRRMKGETKRLKTELAIVKHQLAKTQVEADALREKNLFSFSLREEYEEQKRTWAATPAHLRVVNKTALSLLDDAVVCMAHKLLLEAVLVARHIEPRMKIAVGTDESEYPRSVEVIEEYLQRLPGLEMLTAVNYDDMSCAVERLTDGLREQLEISKYWKA
ncbi:hypothetical protein CSOJ01_12537 [Colletotrichum sojae]|uniref:Uncharacterized protein n=1 Tax=Colletotrichum sojae TaxID=2175907 RepID=A0A8H6MM88_9PEZI|nr:hypothetical protein CSOJ01_12537 [Colletotrichum sojae]